MFNFNKLKYNLYQLLSLARITNPTGFILLFLPCAMTIAIYSSNIKELYSNLSLIALCSFIIRSIGCIINDIMDRSIDKNIERTKNRPLASGKLTLKPALVLLIILLSLQLYILLYLPLEAILSAFIIFPFILLYPLLKRFTYLPQVFLGFVFNFGVIVTYYTINANQIKAAIFLYIGCIFWTIAYDTIYGFMDYKDDIKNNVKSFALLIKDYRPKLIIAICYLIFLSFCTASTYIIFEHINYISIILLFCSFLTLMKQIDFDISNSASCLKSFKMNNLSGALIVVALICNNTSLINL